MIDPIRYRLTFPEAASHLVHIEALIPIGDFEASASGESNSISVIMPTWTPGSYLIREYARHVESLEAYDCETDQEVDVTKIDKATWRISGLGRDTNCVRIVYRLYCRELSVRTNWVDDEFAFLTGAATFITRSDAMLQPHIVEIEPSDGWPYIACSLPCDSDDQPTLEASVGYFTRRAESYHQLVDSPMLLGNFEVRAFEVGEKQHAFAHLCQNQAWDLDKVIEDCRSIVAYEQKFWKEVPYPHYWFINLALEGYGGLEHDDNTVLLCNRWAPTKRESYIEWLGLVAHEFFHTWNVRRLRPAAVAPSLGYDYAREQYLEELWIAEGITSYYDDLILIRSKLVTLDEYLGLLNKTINVVEEAPGRLVQSLRDSSHDTWIKHYRPDENTSNSRISYYTKGAVVAFLLDAKIQELSSGSLSLDDAVQKLWRNHGEFGYSNGDFELIVEELVEQKLGDWFDRHIRGAEQLDYGQAFSWFGLERVPFGEEDFDLGCDLSIRDGRWFVTRVMRASPASTAGLQVDDEILAFNGWRLGKEGWKERLQQLKADEVVICLSRRSRLMERTLRPQQRQSRSLRTASNESPSSQSNRARWLHAD
jgi:predicted metalloprotease with PDZ domain